MAGEFLKKVRLNLEKRLTRSPVERVELANIRENYPAFRLTELRESGLLRSAYVPTHPPSLERAMF